MNEDLLSWSERLVRIEKFERSRSGVGAECVINKIELEWSRSVLLFIAPIIAQFSLYYSVNNEEIIN